MMIKKHIGALLTIPAAALATFLIYKGVSALLIIALVMIICGALEIRKRINNKQQKQKLDAEVSDVAFTQENVLSDAWTKETGPARTLTNTAAFLGVSPKEVKSNGSLLSLIVKDKDKKLELYPSFQFNETGIDKEVAAKVSELRGTLTSEAIVSYFREKESGE